MTNQTNRAKPPRIVAELGRPETPAETAARKAATSRAHRENQTTRNLILALLASLVIVLFTVLVVVRQAPTVPSSVDYRSIAAQAQQDITQPIAAPSLPKGWRANDAELKDAGGKSQTWYVGFLTPKQQFIALEEGIDPNSGWLTSILGTIQSTGSKTINGVRWTVYDQRTASDPGNFGYSIAATIKGVPVVLHGSADDAEFEKLATAVSTEIQEKSSR
jgi:hypothetical protein